MIIVTLGHSVGGATFESRFLVPLCTKHMVILATTVQTLPLLSVLSLLLSFFSPPPLHLYPETPRNGECDASVLLFLYLKSRRPQTAPLGERTVSPEWPRKDDGQQQAARRLQESLSGPTVGSGRGGMYSQTVGLAVCYFGDETSITSGLDPEPTDLKHLRGRCRVGMMHMRGHSGASVKAPSDLRCALRKVEMPGTRFRSVSIKIRMRQGRGHSADVQKHLRGTSVPRENVH